MSYKTIALTRTSALAAALGLVVASLVPLLTSRQASAAQYSSRKITIGSSKVSLTDVLYTAAFTTATTANLEGIVIDFCSDSPLIGQTCTAPAGFDVNETNLAFAVSGHSGATAFTMHANTDTNTLILSRTDATSNTSGTAITVTLGAGAGNDGVTNPSATGTYYARILTYSTAATAAAYTSTAPGTHTDDGGVALSTANQLTINARVQEQLTFCVGGTTVDDATTSIAADCSAAFTGAGTCGNTIDLGVVSSSSPSISPVAAVTNGNTCNGAAMVRTNAANGVVVSYLAEQETGSGKLKVPTATCSGTSNTDQCFNSSGATQNTIDAGQEEFGVTIGGVNCVSSTAYTCSFAAGTYNLARNAEYDGDGANTFGTSGGFAWVDTYSQAAQTTIASSAASAVKVVDDEALVLKFAAQAALTTPSGSYGVTSTYIATATF